MQWPCTTSFLEGRDLDHWLWTYRVWQGSTYWVLELKDGKWFTWYYTSGANPKWMKHSTNT